MKKRGSGKHKKCGAVLDSGANLGESEQQLNNTQKNTAAHLWPLSMSSSDSSTDSSRHFEGSAKYQGGGSKLGKRTF